MLWVFFCRNLWLIACFLLSSLFRASLCDGELSLVDSPSETGDQGSRTQVEANEVTTN